jgi:PAS domain S-box-containing protein
MVARHLPESPFPGASSPALATVRTLKRQGGRELPGIARVTPAGEFRLLVRDLKARSALDAAVRLAKVAIYAHELLTGEPLSSRKSLTPILRAWRLYDGNTRARLAKERGIVRNGDSLSLDDQARHGAEQLVREMRSPLHRVEPRPGSTRWGPPPGEPGDGPPGDPAAPADSRVAAETSPGEGVAHAVRTHQDFENWDNFAHRCSIGMHAVDRQGTILWANQTELEYLGYRPDEYIGRSIEAFHLDQEVIHDILRRLIEGETVSAYPVRMRAKDGSTRYMLLNSNVYRRKGGEFGHTRCFSVAIDEATWKALKEQWDKKWAA